MLQLLKAYKIQLLLVLSLLAFYAAFAYDLERSDFIKLITLYAGLFFISFKLIQLLKVDFKTLMVLAILVRLVFLVAIPNLSQDFYRFLWDGRLIAQGLSPYLLTPDAWVQTGNLPVAQANELLNGMGSLSRQHYSNYPPVNQFFFALAGLFAGKSIFGGVVVLRLCIIAADLGVLWLGRKLLKALKLPQHQIFWYVLNPFIVIELTGNLHFEGVMLFFLLAALYLLHSGKWFFSAVLLALSISVKLLPLLMLPLLFQFLIKPDRPSSESQNFWLYLKNNFAQALWRLSRYYVVVLLVFALSFLPFLNSALLEHFTATIALWFQKFEFNASIYYLVRWVGFQVKGYNIIETAGKILPLVVIGILALLGFLRKNSTTIQLFGVLLLGSTAYFMLSTTVHPWYIATPLLLSVFTRFRFALVWSFVVILSYSAYKPEGVEENLWLVALEYLILTGFMIWEFVKNQKAAAF